MGPHRSPEFPGGLGDGSRVFRAGWRGAEVHCAPREGERGLKFEDWEGGLSLPALWTVT